MGHQTHPVGRQGSAGAGSRQTLGPHHLVLFHGGQGWAEGNHYGREWSAGMEASGPSGPQAGVSLPLPGANTKRPGTVTGRSCPSAQRRALYLKDSGPGGGAD